MLPPPAPRATYRIQQHGLGFASVAKLVPYFAQLGVSHVYLAPILQARGGSTHGYDVVDHSRIDDSLGGDEGWRTLVQACRENHIAILLDVVPNHMAVDDPANRWWWDVLEDAQASRYARHFDVDWDPPEERLRSRILLPVLGEHYGSELETGKLALERRGGDVVVRYGDRSFPLSPRSLGEPLAEAARSADDARLDRIARALAALPGSHESDLASIEHRHAEKARLRGELATLCAQQPAIAGAVDRTLERISRDPDRLDELLQRQNYRLVYWRAAERELDYRRFFDIAELAALRVEDGRVFDDVHDRVVALVERGDVAGVRIDHPDGLRDPVEYLARLRDHASHAWIVVEKILAAGERLRDDWSAQGSTGYEFLNLVNGLFVDPGAEDAFSSLFIEMTGERRPFDAVAIEAKREVLRTSLAADVERLTELGTRIIERHRRYRDYTRGDVRSVIRELAAAFPIYRTYVRLEGRVVRNEDRAAVATSLARSAEAPQLDRDLACFFASVLTLDARGTLEGEFAMRFQQLTAPAAAKGVEDTAFYRYVRLASLNEVGGDPAHFGVALAEFHEANLERQRSHPLSLLATSTHDTKRSEDVRLRIDALTEIPDEWRGAVRRWHDRLAPRRGAVDGAAEYLFLQTFVGAWPIERERLAAYMEKAAREAKTRTSWTAPDEAYERDLRDFIDAAIEDADLIADIERFIVRIEAARVHSLSQTLLKITAPGVPDLYQGSEIFTNDLVDPDNRRPVDWDARRDHLARVDAAGAHPKVRTIAVGLAARARRPSAYGPDGAYEPLEAKGAHADRVVAFLRGDEAITVAPRLLVSLDDWRDTRLTLPAGSWRDAYTGTRHDGTVRASTLLSGFPVALLERA